MLALQLVEEQSWKGCIALCVVSGNLMPHSSIQTRLLMHSECSALILYRPS